MKTVDSLSQLTEFRADTVTKVGFVPTMGALHTGHQSLMDQARRSSEFVVVSIFVNPSQFGPGEDFSSYPRTREDDLRLCAEAGVDLVWFPQVEDLYPVGHQTKVTVSPLGLRFEGQSRPGHYCGVATVVTKLLNAVRPQQMYLGQKDLQQVVLLERMVKDLLIPTEVVRVPTARDERGLALSSRNRYLSQEQREQASSIYKGLQSVRDAHQGGSVRADQLATIFDRSVTGLAGAEIERFDLLSSDLSMNYTKGESVSCGYCSVAVRYGGVRLIDNIALCC